MDSFPHRDAAQEPGTPRESSDEESIVDPELEEARQAVLKANERFQAL